MNEHTRIRSCMRSIYFSTFFHKYISTVYIWKERRAEKKTKRNETKKETCALDFKSSRGYLKILFI